MGLRPLFLAGFVSLLAALPAQACSCLRHDTAREQIDSADIVFVGRVVHSGPEADPRPLWRRIIDWRGRQAPDHRHQITTFQVDALLKGDTGGDIAIRHLPGVHSAMCGVDFDGRQRRVVLAWQRPQSGFSTSACHLPQFSEDEFRAVIAP